MKWYKAKGSRAARLRQRKYELVRRFGIPADALPGSLTLTHRRCGKTNCRCAQGEGHPLWSLTFMVDGKKRVEWMPEEWVDEIRPLVEQGREFKEAVAEVLAANAELLALWRKESARRDGKSLEPSGGAIGGRLAECSAKISVNGCLPEVAPTQPVVVDLPGAKKVLDKIVGGPTLDSR